jgi:peptidoglycan/LPS O-acetylase OafA/YrhL
VSIATHAGPTPHSSQVSVQVGHTYNLGLQGMRGIAILLVLLNHAELPGFGGGYIGVDVFFVISGYLIGGLLLRELETTGRVDLWAFYARRVRRLLPAALLVILAVLVSIRLLYAPHEQDELLSSLRASSLYAANIWFASRPTDYFGGHTEANPLLHLWSLAVEEQFYLFWPLLMLAVCGAGQGGRARQRITSLVLVTGGASLVACVVVTHIHLKYAFFLTPMRIWEFGVGMLVALRPGWSSALNTRQLGLVGVVALALLVGATLGLDGHLRFPGAWPLLPVLSAAGLLLVAERGTESGIGRLLQLMPLRWLGDCSYSVYLWHWPVFIAAAVLQPTRGPLLTAALIALSLCLGWLSYVGVERVFMRRLWTQARPGQVIVVGLIGCALVAVAAQTMRSAIPRGTDEHRYLEASTWPLVDASGCLVLFDAVDQPPCEFGVKSSANTVVLFGDSHAAQWLPALDVLAQQRGWRVIALTKAVCPSVDTPVDFYGRRFITCEQWRARMFERIERLRPSMVVLASSAGYRDVPLPRWQEGLTLTITRLQALGTRVAYMRDTPHTGLNVPTCWARTAWWGWAPEGACTYAAEGEDDRLRQVAQAEAVVAKRFATPYIDLSAAICSTKRCPTLHDGVPMFRDRTHLSEPFARALAPALGEQLLPLMAATPSR